MTFNVDSDYKPQTETQTGRLPFSSSDADLAGIRVTRAQFARLMGVSKQAVSDWVRSGRIILGADHRFDPRQAVARLLATGDPARLRAKVLAPLVADVAGRDQRIAELEALVADLRDDADFHEQAAAGLILLFDRLQEELTDAWPALRDAPDDAGLAALQGWLDTAMERGAAEAGELSDHFPAPGVDGEGAGNQTEAPPPPMAANHMEHTA